MHKSWILLFALGLALPWFQSTSAEDAGLACDQNSDEEQYAPGLVADYNDAGGNTCRRIDPAIAFAWQERSPDPRIVDREWSATWAGQLLVLAPGEYRLHLYVAGDVALEINGEQILAGPRDKPGWLASPPIELAFGHHALRIRYQRIAAPAQIGLYWSGPQFQLEPVPVWHLWHEQRDERLGSFERGATLVHALRCGACHDQLAQQAVLSAPALDRLSGNLSPEWLMRWIQDAGHQRVDDPTSGEKKSVTSRMPSLGVTADDATAIAAYLLADSTDIQPTDDGKLIGKVEAGAALFRTVGCLACHRIGELGTSELFGGGDLSLVADKRPAGFFARWLRDPASLNASHRMPVFTLSDEEVANLAAYLVTLNSSDDDDRANATEHSDVTSDVRATGARLVAEYRCGRCHALPSHGKDRGKANSIALLNSDANAADCLGAANRDANRPGYLLDEQDAADVRAYVAALPRSAGTTSPSNKPNELDGRLVLAERNCLACHARGLEPGISRSLPALLQQDEALAPRLAALSPPALNSVGDKYHDKALAAAIATTTTRLRPWLEVRMPKFSLSEEESRALVEMFVDEDRLPSVAATDESSPLDETSLQWAGSRLVTSAGFGCTSCHAIGEVAPADVTLAARGTDLAELGLRVRRPWYDRWVRNPARIVPRMEMPSIQLPIRGVLDEQLDEQLAAVWHVLNQPGFTPPPPDAVRVVRSRNVADDLETHVLTDVLEVDDHKYIKPFVVGLPNRHSVLFDLAQNQLAGWWIGDTARQRTRGKTWYWEPAGAPLFETGQRGGDLVLEQGNQRLEPLVIGQFRTECDAWQHLPDGLQFEHRVRFAGDGDDLADPTTLHVVQRLYAIRTSKEEVAGTGFRRQIEVAGLAADAKLRFAILPAFREADSSQFRASDKEATWSGPMGDGSVRVLSPRDAQVSLEDSRPWLDLSPGEDGAPLRIELEYTTVAPTDSFPIMSPAIVAPPPTEMDVVPGFTAERLPLVDEIMPTGLAWRPDGTLVFSSLKGQVWQARDTDGDGLEDTAAVLSDDLAAPYGVAISGHAVDVINKYALLRLYDDDGDGRAERTERLASGWGHTEDYHDWAVGLVRDASGAYYIALPCQQDQREPAEAYLRGRALRLTPHEPTTNDPSSFAIEEFCAGLRFPMGLALHGSGDLFATDNQGNYTPFNELNHLQAGRRYGFINRLENAPGFRPEFTPAAINIPHPWTRSVNGICFLHTPPVVRKQLGRELFGPFEGHLIGCEYDTRSLVRMSLERVGESYQGAVYPFSRATANGEESLLGPLVCQVAPDGDLYVGNIRDSAWGGGANNGSLVRMRPQENLPIGIAEVRATNDGFVIDFTQPLDIATAQDANFFSVSSFRRIPTPDYGGPDQDRRSEKILAAQASLGGRSVRLQLAELREGFVYEIRVRPKGGARWEPAEAYYTLLHRPE